MVEFYAELEFPGLGKIDRKMKINGPIDELVFPIAVSMFPTGVFADIAEAACLNFKRYKFIQRSMYPSSWGSREIGTEGHTKPYIKEMTVIYELGEII